MQTRATKASSDRATAITILMSAASWAILSFFCTVLRTHAPYYLADSNCICPIKTHVRTFSQVFTIQQRHIMMNNAAPPALGYHLQATNIILLWWWRSSCHRPSLHQRVMASSTFWLHSLGWQGIMNTQDSILSTTNLSLVGWLVACLNGCYSFFW
jgi:hypothetical protein